MRKLLSLSVFIFFTLTYAAWACDSCLLQRVGRDTGAVTSGSEDGKFLFKYWFERQEWEYIDPDVAHDLHHDGHHVHVKTEEDVHHFDFGYEWTENFMTTIDLPYVRRGSLDIHDHATLGNEYISEGWGDAAVTAAYDVWKESSQKASVIAGVKLPTGETQELNPQGERFEAELQPGTGSDDYLFGGVYRRTFENFDVTANAIYTFKTEGDQNYEFGDVFSTTLFVDYIPAQDSVFKNVRPGLILSFKDEAKHQEDGAKISDSGGTTVFLGPEISVVAHDNVDLFANVQWPVYQELGGVHQEMDLMWNAGVKVSW